MDGDNHEKKARSLNGKKSVTIAETPAEIIPNPHAVPGAPSSDPYLLGHSKGANQSSSTSGWSWSRGRSDARQGDGHHFPVRISRGFRWGLSASLTPSRTKTVGVIAGLFFSIGWWVFFDAFIYTTHGGNETDPAPRVPIRVEDWIPGVVSTLALIIVNLIEKEVLTGETDDFYSGSHTSAKARLCAFVGLTMALGSICGAVVSCP